MAQEGVIKKRLLQMVLVQHRWRYGGDTLFLRDSKRLKEVREAENRHHQ